MKEMTTPALHNALATGAEAAVGGGGLAVVNIIGNGVDSDVPGSGAASFDWFINVIPGPGVNMFQTGKPVITSIPKEALVSALVATGSAVDQNYTHEDAEKFLEEMRNDGSVGMQAMWSWLDW